MEDYSINCYISLCEQYEGMAQSFFQQYSDLKAKQAKLGNSIDYLENPVGGIQQTQLSLFILQAAISAIVFEALAVESYVNFFGAYRLGDAKYYSDIESPKHKNSALEKMKLICKEEGFSRYPAGGTHYVHLRTLFDKRDMLAHNKPKGHLVSFQDGKHTDEFNDAYKEYTFIFNNLAVDMNMYTEVKENLTRCSGKQEPLAELMQNACSVMEKSLHNMISPLIP